MIPAWNKIALVALLLAATSCTFGRAGDLASEADAAFKNQQYQLAVTTFSALIKQKPNDPTAYNGRALAYKELKQYDRAIADFSKALRLKPDWFVYYNRGVTYDAQANQSAALADFTKAIQLSPAGTIGRTDSLMARAHVYFDQEKAEPALADVDAAIRIDSKQADPFLLRGVLYKIRHQYDQSLADYQKAISLDPKSARGYRAAAYLLSACPMPKYRNGKKAIGYATKACELTNWKSAEELQTLACAYAETGEFNQAVHWQMRATELDPKAVNYRALALYRANEPFRDLNRKEQPVAKLDSIGDSVRIRLGERLMVRFEAAAGGTLHLVPEKTSQNLPPNSLSLDYHQEKTNRVLLLSHSSPQPVTGRCLARLKDYDTYFETDILPMPPGRVNREVWAEPIDELVLFEFRTGDEHRRDQPKQLSALPGAIPQFFVLSSAQSAVMLPKTRRIENEQTTSTDD